MIAATTETMRSSTIDRACTVLLWSSFIAVVIASLLSPMRRTGDAHQYHAMAWAMAHGSGPSLDPSQQADWNAWLTAQGTESGFPGAVPAMRQPALVRDDRQHFSHFWVYPLLAVPWVKVSALVGLHPGLAFVVVNALLSAFALWRVSAVVHPGVGLLLLGTPLIWFISKAQVEVFTWALLTLAMVAAVRRDFVLAAFWSAVASTQNLPIAGAVAVFWVAAAVHWRQARTLNLQRTLVLVAATFLLVVLHPVSTRMTLGVTTPQELNGGILREWPSAARVLALVIDPEIGMLFWVPVLVVLSVVGLVTLVQMPMDQRESLLPAAVCAVVIGGGLLIACAKTTNINSGGSLWMSRYVMWLLPLTVPFLAALMKTRFSRSWLLPILGVACIGVYGWVFAPWRQEAYVTPSPHSEWMHRVAPGLPLPIPEVFWEWRAHSDGGVQGSAASADCDVILLYAEDMTQPCPIEPPTRRLIDQHLATGDRAVWVINPILSRGGPPRVTTAIGAP